MRFSDFCKEVREQAQADVSLAKMEQIITAVCDLIRWKVLADGRVRLRGLGVFKLTTAPSRCAFDFKSREVIRVPARQVVRFTPTPFFRAAARAAKPKNK